MAERSVCRTKIRMVQLGNFRLSLVQLTHHSCGCSSSFALPSFAGVSSAARRCSVLVSPHTCRPFPPSGKPGQAETENVDRMVLWYRATMLCSLIRPLRSPPRSSLVQAFPRLHRWNARHPGAGYGRALDARDEKVEMTSKGPPPSAQPANIVYKKYHKRSRLSSSASLTSLTHLVATITTMGSAQSIVYEPLEPLLKPAGLYHETIAPKDLSIQLDFGMHWGKVSAQPST